ncbi:serine hydrolase [Streptomyces sp. CB02460]|uniref:serine hydrolase n=1 Tax=Streptomyces sp. CB02460 TaxID=1703941 RepID=UPI00093E44B4|nr:serine hydrolase [Streptomyces sp. CB02460]OKJ68724.1 beta-lactamase [Streptomyces sp. CB02460]
MTDTLTQLRAAFTDAGVNGWMHALDIDSGTEVDYQGSQLVSTASVHKLPLLIALHERAAAGDIDLTEQVDCPPDGRASGPTGLAAMADTARLSLRDLAYLMMAVSDNASADVILRRVGLEAVNRTTARLGLARTHALHSFGAMMASVKEDAGPGGAQALADPQVIARLRALDPAQSNRSTPRELTQLLATIWRDTACTPDHCASMRRLMGLQVWPHRLASGFPFDDVHVAGKTGSLPTLRGEVGVVQYPDGGRYAIAVFTRTASTAAIVPAADAVIGIAARIAVDTLRGKGTAHTP